MKLINIIAFMVLLACQPKQTNKNIFINKKIAVDKNENISLVIPDSLNIDTVNTSHYIITIDKESSIDVHIGGTPSDIIETLKKDYKIIRSKRVLSYKCDVVKFDASNYNCYCLQDSVFFIPGQSNSFTIGGHNLTSDNDKNIYDSILDSLFIISKNRNK